MIVEHVGRDLGAVGHVGGGNSGKPGNVVVLALHSGLQQRDHAGRVEHCLHALILHAGHVPDDSPGLPLELRRAARRSHVHDGGEAGRREDGSLALLRGRSELDALHLRQLVQQVDGEVCLVPSPQERLDSRQKSRLFSHHQLLLLGKVLDHYAETVEAGSTVLLRGGGHHCDEGGVGRHDGGERKREFRRSTTPSQPRQERP